MNIHINEKVISSGAPQQTIWVNLHRGFNIIFGFIYTMNPMIGELFSLWRVILHILQSG